MDCPKCDSEQLVETPVLGNIPLDVCPNCKGIWFDNGELEALLRQSPGGASASLELISPKPLGVACPRCKEKMSRGGMVNPLLIVDKCQSCGGVWLDSRELDLLKKQLGIAGATPEVQVARPAPAPAANKQASGLSFMKIVAWAAAAVGLVGASYEMYLYFSPAGAAVGTFSAALAVVSALMLVGGIFYINWND
jgi:Zn-finger nucleic acid-binding protein